LKVLTRLIERLSPLSIGQLFTTLEVGSVETFRKEITEFISVTERIQSIVARGERLSSDEAGVVRLCATELLEKVPEPL
jgi:hypothetical protein